MDPASGMHEGNVEEENTVELLRELLHSDDDARFGQSRTDSHP